MTTSTRCAWWWYLSCFLLQWQRRTQIQSSTEKENRIHWIRLYKIRQHTLFCSLFYYLPFHDGHDVKTSTLFTLLCANNLQNCKGWPRIARAVPPKWSQHLYRCSADLNRPFSTSTPEGRALRSRCCAPIPHLFWPYTLLRHGGKRRWQACRKCLSLWAMWCATSLSRTIFDTTGLYCNGSNQSNICSIQPQI